MRKFILNNEILEYENKIQSLSLTDQLENIKNKIIRYEFKIIFQRLVMIYNIEHNECEVCENEETLTFELLENFILINNFISSDVDQNKLKFICGFFIFASTRYVNLFTFLEYFTHSMILIHFILVIFNITHMYSNVLIFLITLFSFVCDWTRLREKYCFIRRELIKAEKLENNQKLIKVNNMFIIFYSNLLNIDNYD